MGVVFGLVVTSYDTYKTVLHVRFNNEWGQCVKQAEQWVPSPGDKTFPGEWEPERKAIIPLDDLPSRTFYARYYLASLCDDHFRGLAGLPAHLHRAIRSWDNAFLVPLWAESPSNQSYALAILPLIWGLILSAALGAIPWGVFYLVRWIVQGFKGEKL